MLKRIAFISLPIIAVAMLFLVFLDYTIVRNDHVFERLQETKQQLQEKRTSLQEVEIKTEKIKEEHQILQNVDNLLTFQSNLKSEIQQAREDYKALYVASLIFDEKKMDHSLTEIGYHIIGFKEYVIDKFNPQSEDYYILYTYLVFAQRHNDMETDMNSLKRRIMQMGNRQIKNLYDEWKKETGRWSRNVMKVFQISEDEYDKYTNEEDIESLIEKITPVPQPENYSSREAPPSPQILKDYLTPIFVEKAKKALKMPTIE